MPTINQLVAQPRKKKSKRKNNPLMAGNPQRKVVLQYVGTRTPKKPNSAMRKIAVGRFSENKTKNKKGSKGRSTATVYLPGESVKAQVHQVALIKGGGPKDLGGVNVKVITGTADIPGIEGRAQGRSRYGTKKPKKK